MDRVFGQLGWRYRPVLVPSGDITYGRLSLPDLTDPSFFLTLFTTWRPPPTPDKAEYGTYACSGSLWDSDGLVLVKRVRDRELSLAWALANMIFSARFVNFGSFVALACVVAGAMLFAFELSGRHKAAPGARPWVDNREIRGVGDGIWLAIATMATVGYGDCVARTALGKTFSIFFMFFGILGWGALTGNINLSLASDQNDKSIKSAFDLVNVKVGVLQTLSDPVMRDVNFGEALRFQQQLCDDLEDCVDRLFDKQSVDGIIVPHSDVLEYFLQKEDDWKECGRPLKIVGSNFTVPNTRRVGATLKLCGFSNRIYASRYLVDGVTTAMQQLQNTVELQDLVRKYLVQGDADSDLVYPCNKQSPYEIPLIIATLVSIVFYFALITWMRKKRNRETARRVLRRFATAHMQLTKEEIALKYGLRWLAITRRRKEQRRLEKQAKAVGKMIGALCSGDQLLYVLGRLSQENVKKREAMQDLVQDIGSLYTQLARMMRTTQYVAAFLGVVIIAVSIALLIMWCDVFECASFTSPV
eukprot:CAMPEP_0206218272 /NCGR_PEP_ID=MMETSP0047_2-20121206/3712_1 /ASSEMBLY_ACC=CAM_ASM_000192 /TAXON_ID=195065 /ORGANISM="Chroomonas mesostigmatica_cf, Strain CCMP1168" /LENGTH=528 /DNA_ID=CAMNT_0053640767 /DNA_START=161 /DNA_END=1747 /DNA_ORIENTATION=-